MRVITGSNAEPSPLRPDYSESPTVEIGFLNRVHTAANGTETRAMARRHPLIRSRFTSFHHGHEECARVLAWLSSTANSSAVLFPDFRELCWGRVTRGSRVIHLLDEAPGFAVGRHVQLEQDSWEWASRITAVSADGRRLTLADALPIDAPHEIGSYSVRTVVPGSLEGETQVQMITGDMLTVSASFLSFPGLHDYPISADAPVYFSGESDTAQSVSLTRNARAIDNGGRRIEVMGPDAYRAVRVIQVNHRPMEPRECEATRRFIDRCRGRLRSFTMPRPAVQGVLLEAASGSSQFPAPGFVISAIQTYALGGRRLHRFVFDGDPAKVVEPVQVSDPGEGRRQLVDLSFPNGLTARFRRFYGDPRYPVVYEAIAMSDGSDPAQFIAPAAPPVPGSGSLVSTYRLASDGVTLTYLSKCIFDVSLSCIELPDGRV